MERPVLLVRAMPKPILDLPPFLVSLALDRNKGGGGGAPAELGLPRVTTTTRPRLATQPARSLYA